MREKKRKKTVSHSEEKRERQFKNSKRHKSSLGLKIALIVTAVVMLTGVFAYKYIQEKYTINNIIVEGNVHYTSEEIVGYVMSGKMGHNSLYLSVKYKWHEMETIPFVAAIEIKIENPDTVRITVYEKKVAGYVTYLGRNMYFDKDGTIVESSDMIISGVPEVRGLEYDHVVMAEKLPVENDEVFAQVLDLTQSMNKYGLSADKVYFDKMYKITLYFDKVRVEFGSLEYIDEKFSRLQTILPNLVGKSGVLNLDGFDGTARIIPFKQDKK